MVTTAIPKAYVIRSGYAPHSVLAGAREAISVAIALWPLTATLGALAAAFASFAR